MESQERDGLNNVEDDMKKMGVRSWRKMAVNLSYGGQGPAWTVEPVERERGIVDMHVSTPFYRKLKFSLRWFFSKMCV